jgi:hypothetical protein
MASRPAVEIPFRSYPTPGSRVLAHAHVILCALAVLTTFTTPTCPSHLSDICLFVCLDESRSMVCFLVIAYGAFNY